jgi:hypothetical protein
MKDKFIDQMSDRKMDLQKYKGSLHNKLTIRRAFKNGLFGGSFIHGLNNGKIIDSNTMSNTNYTNVKTNYIKNAIYS